MKVISSYKIKILNYNKIFDDTAKKYREMVTWYINILDKEWEENKMQDMSDFDKNNLVDKLTHKTKENPNPKYNFKEAFYGENQNQRVPSNYKNAAKSFAIGSYSSYYSNLKNWEQEDEKTRGKRPTLQNKRMFFPVLYKSMDNVYIRTSYTTAKIKIYNKKQNIWKWMDVKLKGQNVRNVTKKVEGQKEDSPTLQKDGNRWYLCFPFETDVKLETVKAKNQLIASVYLGIDPNAVITIMNRKGEILARNFINYKDIMSKLEKATNYIRKAQKQGSISMPYKWRRVNDLNRELARKIAKEIVDYSMKFNINTIVFEKLDKTGKKSSKNKQIQSLWRGSEIQKLVEHKCHLLGKRVSTVCGYKVKSLAFDGSGSVTFDKENKNRLCIFKNGKRYNIYLNASYNLGARYFIRELIKENSKLKGKKDEEIEELFGKTSERVLDTLKKLNKNFIN